MALLISIILAFFLPTPWNAVIVVVGVLVEVGEVIWGRRLARKWRPRMGPETMIGMRAEVVTPCRPTGQVRVNGEIWEAACATGLDVGDTAIVKRMDGLTLTVEPAQAAESVKT